MAKTAVDDTSYTETEFHYYAFGYGTWGRGRDEAEAMKNLRASGTLGDRYMVYRVAPGTDFRSDGSFGTPFDQPEPVIVKKMRKMVGGWQDVTND